MNGKFEDFIGVWERALPQPNCERIIEKFKMMRDLSCINGMDGTNQFPDSNAGRKDYAYNLQHLDDFCYNDDEHTRDLPVLNQFLLQCLESYVKEYGVIDRKRLYSHCNKVQHTPAGGGYHVWHDELGEKAEHSDRVLVWMCYLNEEFEGGETEFLYQKRRIKPTTGTMLIWPAYFTHHHRGGLVLNGDKYVVTGWFHQNYA